jgi:sulfur carrier protein
MHITFNNSSQQIEDSSTVLHLLETLVGQKLQGVAVAINQTIVPKAKWQETTLKPDDNVLVIKAAQGG